MTPLINYIKDNQQYSSFYSSWFVLNLHIMYILIISLTTKVVLMYGPHCYNRSCQSPAAVNDQTVIISFMMCIDLHAGSSSERIRQHWVWFQMISDS